MEIKIKCILTTALLVAVMFGQQTHLFGQEPGIVVPEKNVQQCIEILKDTNKSQIEKLMAINTLGKMGLEAKDAIPTMLEVIQDTAFFVEGCHALMKMGPDVVPSLIKIVQDKEAHKKARISAAGAFGLVRPPSMLKQNPKESREIIALLEKAITDPHEHEMVRYSAGCSLGMLGTDAKQSIPSLIRLFSTKSENSMARFGAGRALAEICPENEKVFLMIAGVLTDKEEKLPVRIGACSALSEMHPKAERVIPILVETFQNPSEASDLRGAAAMGMAETVYRWSLVAEQGKVTMLLTRALQNENVDTIVRSAAAISLGVVDPKGKITCSILVETLQNKDEHELVRAGAILGLEEMDVVTTEAIPALKAVKEDGSIKLRRLAVRVLYSAKMQRENKNTRKEKNQKGDEINQGQ